MKSYSTGDHNQNGENKLTWIISINSYNMMRTPSVTLSLLG